MDMAARSSASPAALESPPTAPDWARISAVCLDMDGTILDLNFDNRFWQVEVPRRYAELRGITPDDAWSELEPRLEARRGTLEWYCVDHWSEELGFDVAAMKDELAAGIRYLPGAEESLRRIAGSGKRRLLTTNAHPTTIAIKTGRTGLAVHFDTLVSSHVLGAPKESREFWTRLLDGHDLDPATTLYVDDSPPVLLAARAAGIRWIYQVLQPDTAESSRDAQPGFCGIRRLADLVETLPMR
jgi:putative hydrolase of the HAD superfamily